MSDTPPPRSSFLEELKRRKVVRVGLVYGAVAFAVLQAADILVPTLALPGWVLSALVLVTLLGFPLALVLAWAFDVTPEGVQRTEGLQDAPDAPSTGAAAGRTSWLGVRTVAAVVGLVLLGWLAGSWTSSGGGDGAALADADGLDPLRVAVLPFRNAARDDESALIVAGLHDDILTRLSRVGALSVVSRTSVMEYDPEEQHSIRAIARELEAGTIIEGSVQRAGGTLRVNVQLIDGNTDEHLWGENYDEAWSMENVFSIQSRIAESVATRLEAELTPEERVAVAARPTDVDTAWERYHQGVELWNRAGPMEAPETVRLFELATDADPGFLEAWAMLARAHAYVFWLRVDPDPARLDMARAALDRALALDPDHPEAILSEAWYRYWGFLDYAEALAAFRRAEELGAPGGDPLHGGIAAVYRRMGRTEDALTWFRRSAELDPLNAVTFVELSATALLLRRYGETRGYLDRAEELAPTLPDIHRDRAWSHLMERGDLAAAQMALEAGLERGANELELLGHQADLDLMAADPERLLERLSSSPPPVVTEDQYRFWPLELYRGLALSRLGGREAAARSELEAALRVLEEERSARPGDERLPSAMGIAYAALGRRAEALEAGRLGMELLPLEREAWRGAARLEEMALIHALLGEAEPATELLARLLDHPYTISVESLRVDRRWDPIRDDPAFQALLEG